MAFVVTKMGLTFLKPARIDDALVVRTWYDAVKGPRLLISQAITRGDDILCRADVEVACIHMDGRPRRPTRTLVEKVTPWLAPEA
jgi:acyl-CoA thioester hydrolase